MQTPYFAALLAAGLVLGVVATSVPVEGPGAPRWSNTERVAQFVSNAPQRQERAELLPILPVAMLITATGRPLSCAEVRSMDEVELLTDESYCR